MTQFIFNELNNDDIEKYVSTSNVFNMTEEEIEKDKVTLTYFEDEKLGASTEKLDVAVYNDGKWEILDIADKITDYTEIPMGYILKDVPYTRVLVIIRRMSTMVLDKVKESVSHYIYCKVPESYAYVNDDKSLFGLLAKSQVYLDVSEDEIKSQIQKNIVDRNDEICSRLFQ